MKKTLLTSLLILLGFVLSYGQTAPSGTGTEADPYQIATLDNLVWLAQTDSVWDDGAYFAQTADIDASATDTMNIGGFDPGWSGIGSASTSFTGFYDGAGFVIDGLAVNKNKPNSGLFASVKVFEVKNLGITNVDMSVGGSSGALVGSADSSITVTNCYATGEIVGNSSWTGGLIGFIKNANYTITDSHTDVNVLNDGAGDNKYAAGFIGYIETTGDYIGKIENCYSTGNVSLTDKAGKAYAGGFIAGAYALGATTWSEITKCYSTGDVIGAIGNDGYAPAGGFIAYLYWNFKVSECYATGNVTNKGKNGGGFIAYMKYASIVENCYSLGDVTRVEGSTQPNYGGFVGYQRENAGGASIIKNCYSIGKVTGIDGNNGFIGNVDGANSLDTLCYWDAEASGQNSTDGNAMGKTTVEMKTEATFAGWDFADVWEIESSYPSLINVINPDLVTVLTVETVAAVIVDADNNGVPDRKDEVVKIQGVITTKSFSGSSVLAGLQDATAGIVIYQSGNDSANVMPGDKVELTGAIGQYNGLTELYVTEITKLGTDVVPAPVVVTPTEYIAQGEALEGKLVKIMNVSKTDDSVWPTSGKNGAYLISDGVDTLKLWIKSSTLIADSAEVSSPFNVTGIAAQWSKSNSTTSGFQLWPRFYSDFEPIMNSDIPLSGSGTELDPYQISTLDDLVWLAKNDSVWDDSLYFKQTADIDAAPTDTMVIGGFNPGWSGIGNATTSFKGTYDGNGFVIDGLVSHGTNPNVGLFGSTQGITIKDLGLSDVNMSVGGSSGALVGYAEQDLIIDNCYATGNMAISGLYIGGLVGNIVNARFSITNSYTDIAMADVGTVQTVVGGFIGNVKLMGDNDFGGKIEDCYSKGDIGLTADVGSKSMAGGFIGWTFGDLLHTKWSSIKSCYATGEVVGPIASDGFSPAGGFIAYHAWRYKIEECYSTGNVTSMGKDAGGFAGYVKYEAAIENCYSTGNVTRTGGAQPNFGGFVGFQNSWSDGTTTFVNSITNCYSTGLVTGVDVNGYGFSGNLRAGNIDSSNYYDAETSLQDSTVGNAMGKTTAEMKTEATFAGWDFASTWKIVGNNYPTLKTIVSVDGKELDVMPTAYKLEQNYPNPFNPTTVINFALPQASDVQLSVYNILGEKVAELVNSTMVAGYHAVNFNASNLTSGIYIYRITAGSFVSTQKMMLLK